MREVRNPHVAVGLLPPSRKGEAAGMSRYRGDATAVQFPVHVQPRGGTRDLGGDWNECVRTPVSIHSRHPSISLTTLSVKSQAAACPSPQRCGMLPTLPLPQAELAPLQGSLPAPASCPSFLCLVSPSPLTTICCTGCPKNARKS